MLQKQNTILNLKLTAEYKKTTTVTQIKLIKKLHKKMDKIDFFEDCGVTKMKAYTVYCLKIAATDSP